MSRRFLSEEAQARFTEARIDAVSRMIPLIQERQCQFVVVAGDLFDDNSLDPHIIGRGWEALREFNVPVVILPGNHDPLDRTSIYLRRSSAGAVPDNVMVLTDGQPVEVVPGVEVIGGPWTSKHPVRDEVVAALGAAPPASGWRVAVGHGGLPFMDAEQSPAAGLIDTPALEQLCAAGKAQYVALGDRHSVTEVGSSGRIWYSGSPEVTDYDDVEKDSGQVLEVSLAVDQSPVVTPHRVGVWKLLARQWEANTRSDVEAIIRELDAVPNKSRTAVKYAISGSLELDAFVWLEDQIARLEPLFAALYVRERLQSLAVIPSDLDGGDLPVTGYAAEALARLQKSASAPGDQAEGARDALALAYRLTRQFH